MTTITTR